MPSSTALKFSLRIGALAPDKFRVLEFTLNEALSECFHLQVQASCDNGNVAYADMIGAEATLLSYSTQNRVFLKKKLKEILEEVFAANSLTAPLYEYAAKGSPREREYTVQYNETDLDFVNRLLEDEGIFFYFDHSDPAPGRRSGSATRGRPS